MNKKLKKKSEDRQLQRISERPNLTTFQEDLLQEYNRLVEKKLLPSTTEVTGLRVIDRIFSNQAVSELTLEECTQEILNGWGKLQNRFRESEEHMRALTRQIDQKLNEKATKELQRELCQENTGRQIPSLSTKAVSDAKQSNHAVQLSSKTNLEKNSKKPPSENNLRLSEVPLNAERLGIPLDAYSGLVEDELLSKLPPDRKSPSLNILQHDSHWTPILESMQARLLSADKFLLRIFELLRSLVKRLFLTIIQTQKSETLLRKERSCLTSVNNLLTTQTIVKHRYILANLDKFDQHRIQQPIQIQYKQPESLDKHKPINQRAIVMKDFDNFPFIKEMFKDNTYSTLQTTLSPHQDLVKVSDFEQFKSLRKNYTSQPTFAERMYFNQQFDFLLQMLDRNIFIKSWIKDQHFERIRVYTSTSDPNLVFTMLKMLKEQAQDEYFAHFKEVGKEYTDLIDDLCKDITQSLGDNDPKKKPLRAQPMTFVTKEVREGSHYIDKHEPEMSRRSEKTVISTRQSTKLIKQYEEVREKLFELDKNNAGVTDEQRTTAFDDDEEEGAKQTEEKEVEWSYRREELPQKMSEVTRTTHSMKALSMKFNKTAQSVLNTLVVDKNYQLRKLPQSGRRIPLSTDTKSVYKGSFALPISPRSYRRSLPDIEKEQSSQAEPSTFRIRTQRSKNKLAQSMSTREPSKLNDRYLL
jgi:hypothetical protein